jgi:acylphosphatase
MEARIHGQVQGVGFRWFVRSNATRLGLTGWVANEAMGTVRLVAEGNPARLDQLAALLQEGPSGAVVERVDDARLPAGNSFHRFDIRSGSHAGD